MSDKNKLEMQIDEGLNNFNEEDLTINNEIEDNPYPAKVDFNKEQYSVYDLLRKITEYNEIILQPDFQRNEKVWDNKKAVRLIESILMGIPLPLFYFAEQDNGKLAVVDGLQRLTVIKEFFENKFALKKLTYLVEYNNKFFKDLPREAQARIERYQIQANVINSKTPEKIKLDIFERINSGGSPLNKQEMRNAMYLGKSTKLLKELAESDVFKNSLSTRIDSKRMRDRYIILRFLAFYLWGNQDKYQIKNLELTSDFDAFLGSTMKIINKFSDETIEELEKLFYFSIQLATTLYGKGAFVRNHVATGQFNMTIFESLMFILSSINIKNITEQNVLYLESKIDSIFEDPLIQKNFDESLKGKNTMIAHFGYLKNALIEIENELCQKN